MNLSEKITGSSDTVIQHWLRELEPEQLAILMSFELTEEAVSRVKKNMSERAVEGINEEVSGYRDMLNYCVQKFDDMAKKLPDS